MRTCEHFTSINLLRALFFPFLRTPALRAVASIGEYWWGPTCSLHAHNACCMRAICSLQALASILSRAYFYKGTLHISKIIVKIQKVINVSYKDSYVDMGRTRHHNKNKITLDPTQSGGGVCDLIPKFVSSIAKVDTILIMYIRLKWVRSIKPETFWQLHNNQINEETQTRNKPSLSLRYSVKISTYM